MRKLALLCSVVSVASLSAQTAAPTPGGPAAGDIVAPTPSPVAEAATVATAPSVSATATVAPEPSATAATVSTVTSPVAVTPAPPVEPPPVANPNARTVRDFQGDEITTVLRLLARQAGINIMVSDQITGAINMRVENLTPLEAIRVIVEAKGLDMAQSNNVYFIKTSAEKAKEPTEAASYTFSYAKAAETLPLISTQIQSGIAAQIDVRTNTVFYRDYKSNMSNLALFFDSIDRPTQQVMIEARLVEVTANPKQSYGINWSGVLGGASSATTLKWGGSGLPTYTYTNGVPTISGARTVALDGSLNNLVLNGSGKDFASLISGQSAILSVPAMSATLRLLNEDSDAEFLANPRVVTANTQKANIKITRSQPVPKLKYNEQTASTTFDSFEDKVYGNTLEVTPTINKDSFVTMLVKPEISNWVSDASFTIGGTVVTSPIIDTRSLESNVLIKSGDTLAIGGLLQDENKKGRTKVPVLGDIPILGYAFQERLNSRTKRNLLVFITPTIIQQGYGTGLESQVSGLKNSGEEYADPNGWRNNARGALRLVPTSNRQNVADYPKPGLAPAPIKSAARKTSAQTAQPKATPPKSADPKNKLEYKITVPQREE